ncbi:MAG: putative transcriptional regulator [Herbinix sp.]|jgi:ArsR family transcriptional regulator|nr:putative transcriptional regulator [Herbinix sp.]
MNRNYNQMALALKALSDPNRLVIIDYLVEGEQCACKILEQLHITQPTLSHHMRILCETDLVHCRREGKWMHYSLNGVKFQELRELLEPYSATEYASDAGCCS